jgi:estrone sulfotransferase
MLEGLKHKIKNSSLFDFWERRYHHIDLEDVFVVSFPKSGNTWMRFMLTGLYLWEKSGGKVKPNYFNIHTYVKDIHLEKIESRTDFSTGFPRIIKSHRPYTKNYTRTIFIVRDVRDVMISWYKFKNRHREQYGAIEEVLSSESIGVNAWVKHTESWLNSDTNKNKKLLFLRYEDLIDNPIEGLRQIIEFLNIEVSDEGLEWVIQQGDKNRVRALEKTYGRARTAKVPFLRKGEKNQWKTSMKPANIEYINSKAEETLIKCDYKL